MQVCNQATVQFLSHIWFVIGRSQVLTSNYEHESGFQVQRSKSAARLPFTIFYKLSCILKLRADLTETEKTTPCCSTTTLLWKVTCFSLSNVFIPGFISQTIVHITLWWPVLNRRFTVSYNTGLSASSWNLYFGRNWLNRPTLLSQ